MHLFSYTFTAMTSLLSGLKHDMTTHQLLCTFPLESNIITCVNYLITPKYTMVLGYRLLEK